jgi:hypothetical protein
MGVIQPIPFFFIMDALELLEVIEQLDVSKVASDSLQENKEIIADLNASQMYTGLRADGSEILPAYTPLTIEIKKSKGQITDRVTLRDTGDFQASLYAEVKGEEIEYGATDEKAEKLDKKYSTRKGSIFGLNEDSMDDLVEGHLKGTFYDKLHEETGL